LIAVKNMEESKKFYHDILGMNVEGDFGANVQLEGGLFLQTLDTWSYFINGKEVNLKNNAGELYFEVSDIDGFHKKLQTANIEYVHELLEHSWEKMLSVFMTRIIILLRLPRIFQWLLSGFSRME